MGDHHKKLPGCKGLPSGSMNLSYCLVQSVSTSTCLSCMVIGMGVLEFEVSMTAELLPLEGVPLAGRVVTGVCGTVTVFTGVSGSSVAGLVGCSNVLHIPWLFLDGLSGPVVKFMSVTNLPILKKIGQYLKFILF